MNKRPLPIPHLNLNRTQPARVHPSLAESARCSHSHFLSSRSNHTSSLTSRKSMQSSMSARSNHVCPQMRQSTESFTRLQEKYRQIMLKLPSDVIDPEFPRQFKRFTQAYDAYTKQVSLHYSTVNPTRKIYKTSPLYKAGQSVMTEWADFIECSNTLESNGLSPYTAKINKCYGVLYSTIVGLEKDVHKIQYKTDKAILYISAIKKGLLELRDIISQLFIKPCSRRWDDFDEEGFMNIIRQMHSLICQLFDSFLPQYCSPLGDLTRTRQILGDACADIGSVTSASKIFDIEFPELKEIILQVNEELNSMHQKLDLPFTVQITIEVEEEPDDI